MARPRNVAAVRNLMTRQGKVAGPQLVILGVFVADAAYRASRLPEIGETLIGQEFKLGPGGKGSNQAVAAARLGTDVAFISRIGRDPFADIAKAMWKREGIRALVEADPENATGSAFIFVDSETGDNAIIIAPGAAGKVGPADLERNRRDIESSRAFMTQLEVPLEAAAHGLRIARDAGVVTILNPAPAADLPTDLLSNCDFLIPNETEAEQLTGCPVNSVADAADAAKMLRSRGCRTVIITLGQNGAFLDDGNMARHLPVKSNANPVDTTGAGDAFCGAFAHAIVNGQDSVDAAQFAGRAAGISVTRPGTAPSMATLQEVKDAIDHG